MIIQKIVNNMQNMQNIMNTQKRRESPAGYFDDKPEKREKETGRT